MQQQPLAASCSFVCSGECSWVDCILLGCAGGWWMLHTGKGLLVSEGGLCMFAKDADVRVCACAEPFFVWQHVAHREPPTPEH